MTTVSSKSLVRVESTERVDEPDFTHLSRQVLDFHESIVGSVLAQNAVVKAGWDLVTLSTTDLRIERNDGFFIGPESGVTDGIHNVGVTSSSAVFDFGGTNSVVSFAGLGVGAYHIYIYHRFFKANQQVRVKFNNTTQQEFTDTFEVRFEASWFSEILPVATSPPVDRVRIATVDWDGSDLATSVITRTLPLLFEGQAVTGGSILPHVGSGFTGTDPLVDFNRSSDRIANGLVDLAGFTNAALKCIEEVKSQEFPSWFTKPRHGMALDAVLPVTYTIGQGTVDSVGMFNADGTTIVSGDTHYNVDTAIDAAIAAATADATVQVVILFKPGLYYTNSDHVFPRDGGVLNWTIKGPSRTGVRFYLGATGQLIFPHAGSGDAASIEFIDITLQGTSGPFIEYEGTGSHQGGTKSANRYHFSRVNFGSVLGFTTIQPVPLTAETGVDASWFFEDCDFELGGTMRLAGREIVINGGNYGPVVLTNAEGTMDSRVSVSNCVLVSIESQNDVYEDFKFSSCRIGSIVMDSAGSAVTVDDCTFPEEIPAQGSYRIQIIDAGDLVVSNSIFEQLQSDPTTFIYTEGDGVFVDQCRFLRKSATTFPGTYAVDAVGTDKDRSVVRSCYLDAACTNGFRGVDVYDTTVEADNTAGLTGIIFDHDLTGTRKPYLEGLKVESVTSHGAHLARDFFWIKDSTFTIPQSIPGIWELVHDTGVDVEVLLDGVTFETTPALEVEIRNDIGTLTTWGVTLRNVTCKSDLTISTSETDPAGRWNLDDVRVNKTLALTTNSVAFQTLNANLNKVVAPRVEIDGSFTNVYIDQCFIGFKSEPSNGLVIIQQSNSPCGHCVITNSVFSEVESRTQVSVTVGVHGTVTGAINDSSCISITHSGADRFHTVVIRDNVILSLLQAFDSVLVEAASLVEIDGNTVHALYTAGQSAQAIFKVECDRVTLRNNDIISQGSGGTFDAPRILHVTQFTNFNPTIIKVESNAYRMISARHINAEGLVKVTDLAVFVVCLFSFNNNTLFMTAQSAATLIWDDAIAAVNCKNAAIGNILHDTGAFLVPAVGALPGMSLGFAAATSVNISNAG